MYFNELNMILCNFQLLNKYKLFTNNNSNISIFFINEMKPVDAWINYVDDTFMTL